MQVFEVFDYNLNYIKFKDNKDFFDAMLKELDLVYSDIAFCFEPDHSGFICDKAIKYFPALKEYKQYLEVSARSFGSPAQYRLSSIYTDETGCFHFYIKQEHKDAFSTLLKKIPHAVNFGFMGVVLDNIDWYVEETPKPTFCSPKEQNKIYDYNFSGYFSNSIRFFKAYDYGNKLNSVKLMIERTEENGDLCPYPTVFSQMLTILGKPKYQYLKCYFDGAEKERLAETAKTINQEIAMNNMELLSDVWKSDVFKDKAEHLIDSVTPITGFSPKTIFNKSAKKKGYKYISFLNGRYSYCKQNEYNHTYSVEFTNIPCSSFFEISFSVKGYNFNHLLYTANQVTMKNTTCAETYADKAFETALKMEENYTKLLVSEYGKTPVWFVNSRD